MNNQREEILDVLINAKDIENTSERIEIYKTQLMRIIENGEGITLEYGRYCWSNSLIEFHANHLVDTFGDMRYEK